MSCRCPFAPCSCPTAASARSRGAPASGRRPIPPARRRRTTSWRASRRSKARAKIVELLAASGDLLGEPRADHAPGEVLREGRPAARDHHEPAVVHQDDRLPRGADRARPRARVAAAVHALALRELGRGAERRLGREPPALLRRAVPGVVPAGRRWPRAVRRGDCRVRRSAADRPVDGRAAGYTDGPARSAERLHRRPGCHGHVGHLVADAADCGEVGGRSRSLRARVPDGPAAAGARHHPHVALLHRRARTPRARHGALDEHRHLGVGAGSGPQEDVEVQGQRRHADGAARGARVGRRALLGGERAAGHRHRVRPGADEGGTAARDQAAERVEVRAGPRGAARRDHVHRSIAAC